MIIDFARKDSKIDPININESEIERVDTSKLLGITILNNLSWETHVTNITNKASHRLFMLRLLKRAQVDMDKLLHIYTMVIKPIVEYACQVWHPGLNKEHKKLIESIQERALKIIMPNASYELAQQISELPTLETRRVDLCRNLFKEIQDPRHKLHHLLPPIKKGSHDLRDVKKYPLPKIHTNRGKATFTYKLVNNNNNNNNNIKIYIALSFQ